MNAKKTFLLAAGIITMFSNSSCRVTIKPGEYVDIGAGFATATPENGNMGDGSDVVVVPTIHYEKTAATYVISVWTGDLSKAGTDANVYINLIGEDHRETGWVLLNTEDHDDFERGNLDQFEWVLVNVGELQKVCVQHDNSGDDAGWFLEKIQIENDEGDIWQFLFSQWLADDEGSGSLSICQSS